MPFLSPSLHLRKLRAITFERILKSPQRVDVVHFSFFIILAMILFLADIPGRRFGWEPARRSFKLAGKKQSLQPEGLPEGAAEAENAAPGMAGQPANAQFNAAPGQMPGPGVPGMNTGAPGAQPMPAGGKAQKGKASKKKAEPENDTLDTSALLKKKRERNNG